MTRRAHPRRRAGEGLTTTALADTGIDERRFQGMVEGLARFYGWTSYHTFDSRRSAKGFLDLSMWRAPEDTGETYIDHKTPRVVEPQVELLFSELKVGKRKLTPEQKAWLDALRGAGVEAYEWRWPECYEDMHERLARGRVRVEPEWAPL